MNIQGFGGVAQIYAAIGPTSSEQRSPMPVPKEGLQDASTQVAISTQAKALASSEMVQSKDPKTQTAEDIDDMQKTGGFVNTMANLSPVEKQLYNELVAKGDTDAVRGMNLLALSRMDGGDVTLPNGRTFDPGKTEITANNVRQLFSQMFVSADDQGAKSFEALASYLDGRTQASV